jgi:hypothetical protein
MQLKCSVQANWPHRMLVRHAKRPCGSFLLLASSHPEEGSRMRKYRPKEIKEVPVDRDVGTSLNTKNWFISLVQ